MTSDPTRWPLVSRILDEAFDLPADQQKSFVQRACAGDLDLLEQVEALLDADSTSGEFLQANAAQQAATLLVETGESDLQFITFGAFRTVSLLGYGGMGVVYLARRADGEFEQEVAIKCMRGITATPELQRRFLAERQILARLQHPAIAHLLDGGVTEDGNPYFAMEYVDGIAFTTYCDQQRLRIKDRIGLFLQICAGVSYAHSNLVIHRDLKPSNILIVNPDQALSGLARAQVKLLDFGIAKLLEDEDEKIQEKSNDQTRAQLLTLEYATPEQLLKQPITTRTDVYALGLLLFELLSGFRAHGVSGKSVAEAKQLICEHIPCQPSEAMFLAAGPDTAETAEVRQVVNARRTTAKKLRRRLRGDLDAIVMKALQKSPHDRYSSVEAMAEDLQRCLDLQAVKARDGGWRYRIGKFLYRYRWGVSATALILVLLAGMTAVSIRSNIEIRGALETARIETAKAREIAQFLHELFEVGDPFAEKDDQISINDLLNRGAERISRDLAGQPETQSQLMFELARIHNSLGMYSRAADLLEQTLTIQQTFLGDSDPEIARTLFWQSVVADDLGEYERSEELAETALEMRLRLLDRHNPDVGESMDRLGSLLAYSGETDRALALSHEAVVILDAALGQDDPRTQSARHNLAWMLGITGRYAEAVPVYEQVISVARRVAGEEHPETLSTLNNFANMLRHMGTVERAEKIHRQVLASRLRILDGDHPEVGISQNNLAKLLQGKGEFEEAAKLYQQSLAILKLRYGAEHTNVAISMSNLAQVLFRQGQIEAAESRYLEALAVHRKSSPPGSVKITSTLMGLGRLLTGKGSLAEAEDLLREALSIRQRALVTGHWEIAESQLRLGQLMIAKGDFEQAETLLTQSNATLIGQFDEEHKLVQQSRKSLARLIDRED